MKLVRLEVLCFFMHKKKMTDQRVHLAWTWIETSKFKTHAWHFLAEQVYSQLEKWTPSKCSALHVKEFYGCSVQPIAIEASKKLEYLRYVQPFGRLASKLNWDLCVDFSLPRCLTFASCPRRTMKLPSTGVSDHPTTDLPDGRLLYMQVLDWSHQAHA